MLRSLAGVNYFSCLPLVRQSDRRRGSGDIEGALRQDPAVQRSGAVATLLPLHQLLPGEACGYQPLRKLDDAPRFSTGLGVLVRLRVLHDCRWVWKVHAIRELEISVQHGGFQRASFVPPGVPLHNQRRTGREGPPILLCVRALPALQAPPGCFLRLSSTQRWRRVPVPFIFATNWFFQQQLRPSLAAEEHSVEGVHCRRQRDVYNKADPAWPAGG